ncbi:hypothetical protein E8E13_007254 [Curvularia kusanoi]|uniref:Uncharacterized protein n=1 Tax=Curvularia kusanoi TaxID=90978 RepID=A0A9P4TGY9_CURKU|nr:hypothetical protein E8E13_007254 [Curvularia kusanoi]
MSAMPPTTVAELKSYAEVHFPDEFASLPDVKLEVICAHVAISDLRLEDRFDIAVICNRVEYEPRELKQIKPFCWINPGCDEENKMHALLCYYVSLKFAAYDGSLFLVHPFLEGFMSACADVSSKSVPSKLSEVQQLQDRQRNSIQGLQDHSDSIERRVEMSEHTITTLQIRIADLEARSRSQNTTVNNNDADWARLFATAKLENEELKSKLAIAEGQTNRLLMEIAELHGRMAG